MAKVYYNGHGSLRLTTAQGTVIYIDPYAGEGYNLPADIILVSHQHGDHNQIQLPAKKQEYQVVQNFDMLKHGQYAKISVKDIEIEAVPAYNSNHSKEECVGFLIKADNLLLYFAGDTSKIQEMESLRAKKVDYAFLPCDGIYNMDIEEASECAAIIGARHSVPVHMKPGSLFDRERANLFQAEGRILIEAGVEIEL